MKTERAIVREYLDSKHFDNQICPVCKNAFSPERSNQRVCSEECQHKYDQNYSAEYRSKHHIKQQKSIIQPRKCEFCEKLFQPISVNNIYCSNECLKQKATPIGKLRFAILYRDEFRCQYCGNTPQDGIHLHVDHIIPKSKGGTDDINNMITSCEICNLGKLDILLDENPIVKISEKAIEILSQEVLSRAKLKDLGIYQEYQLFLRLPK